MGVREFLGDLFAMKKAVVLLSGGLDSATTLYFAKEQGFSCSCLIFDYGQRHKKEIQSAKKIARSARCLFKIIKIALPWKGSALLDRNVRILSVTKPPCLAGRQASHQVTGAIPNTYVPGRNIIFLSFALSYAEAIGAQAVFIGANAIDYSGYPDCRPEFYRAFKKAASRGMKSGVEKRAIEIKAPLIHKTKVQIVKLGNRLGVPFALTWSCYRGDRFPRGKCDSRYFRAQGFKEAKVRDPLLK